MALSKRSAPYVFLSPALVFGALLFLLPLAVAFWLSFTAWNGLSAPRFVGLANYRFLLLADPLFWRSVGNSLVFVGGTIALGVPLALVFALAFRRARWKPLWRAAFWLPMVTNIVAVAYVWRFVLNDPYGLANRLLAFAGIAGPDWLNDPAWAMAAVVVIFVWFHLGQDMMLFSAALDGVDPEVEEAARLDGASAAQTFWRITLPLLRPAVLLVTVTNLIKGVGYFELMLVLTEGGPADATHVAAYHTYRLAFTNLKLGMASAAAYLLLAIVLLLAFLQLRLLRRGGVESWT